MEEGQIIAPELGSSYGQHIYFVIFCAGCPAARVLPSSGRRLKPPLLRPPVGVLPALHQYQQRVELEEDDDGDDDALEDNPDVDAVGARHQAVVSQLLDRRRWVLEAKGEGTPDDKVQQNQEGDNLQMTPVDLK